MGCIMRAPFVLIIIIVLIAQFWFIGNMEGLGITFPLVVLTALFGIQVVSGIIAFKRWD